MISSFLKVGDRELIVRNWFVLSSRRAPSPAPARPSRPAPLRARAILSRSRALPLGGAGAVAGAAARRGRTGLHRGAQGLRKGHFETEDEAAGEGKKGDVEVF